MGMETARAVQISRAPQRIGFAEKEHLIGQCQDAKGFHLGSVTV